MASTSEAAERTAFLKDLNARVDSAGRYFESLKQARDIVVGDMLNGSAASAPPTQHRTRTRRRKNNTPRVQRLTAVLDNAPGPVSVSDIKAEFERQGWDDGRPFISSTLSYMKRIGSAKQPERGKWQSVTGVQQAA